jgi:hypothetical protein
MSPPPCCARMLKGTRGIWIFDPVVRGRTAVRGGAHCRAPLHLRCAGGALPCAPTFTPCGGGAHCRAPLHLRRAGGAHCRAPLHLRRAGGAHCRAPLHLRRAGGGALPCAPTFTPCGGGALPCAPTFTPCGGRTAVRPYIYAVRGGAHCRAPLHLRRAGGAPTFNLHRPSTFNLSTFPTSIPASIHFWYASNVPLK